MKYLVVFAVVVVALWWLRRSLGGPRQPGADGGPSRREADVKPAPTESMQRCAHCGVHLPRSEVVTDADGRTFCSLEHRLAHEGDREPR